MDTMMMMMNQPPPNMYYIESEAKKRMQEAELKSRLGDGEMSTHRSSRKAALVALAIILIVTIGGVILLYMVG